jgi:trigger factor
MQFTVSTTQGLERRIEVEIPHTRVAGEVDRRLRDLARTANVRGFRKGKVPLPVIKQQFGSQVHGDTVSELIRQGYSDAVNQEKLRPAGGPRIEPIQIAPGDNLKFAAVFEILPDVSLKPVSELALERPTADISESDIDAMIESMRKQRVTYAPVTRAGAKGDRVTVDFLGRLDGVAFAGGEGKDTPFVLGAGRAIPEFEAAIEGMATGETKTAPVKFPDNYGAKELAGKSAEFDITVKSVDEAVLPVVDEAFAQAFGLGEGGVGELREEVRKSMEREASEAVRVRMRTQVFEALQRDNPIELPRALVDEQVQQLQMDMMQRTGATEASQIPAREPFEEPARRRVTLGLLVGELIRREDIKIDRERVHARLNEIAAGYPNAEEVRRAYLQNADALRQIETGVLEDQAVDWVLANARVTDRATSFAELTGFGRQA